MIDMWIEATQEIKDFFNDNEVKKKDGIANRTISPILGRDNSLIGYNIIKREKIKK